VCLYTSTFVDQCSLFDIQFRYSLTVIPLIVNAGKVGTVLS